MTNTPILNTLNEAGEAERASIMCEVLDWIARPTPTMRWLERAAKQLRETSEAE